MRPPVRFAPARAALLLASLALWQAAAAADPGGLQPPGLHPGEAQSYIVVLRPDTADAGAVASELGQAHRFDVARVYEHALKGFSATMPAAAAEALRRNPRVEFVEADQPVQLMSTQLLPTGVRRIFAPDNPLLAINDLDEWRVDVDVAVLDTGIDANHPDLNVVATINCSGGNPNRGSCKSGGADDHGHGTHVAGVIGAIDNGYGVVGVAPGARLWSVKVLLEDGAGYTSWIIAGIDWVTARAHTIRVANLSFGCECPSQALNQALTSSVNAGVTYVVSAGNENKDAATFSPANHPGVITVSAITDFDGLPGGLGASTCRSGIDDRRANFSNFGQVIDLAAPGVCILSTWPGGTYRTQSGTSISAPHVAGAAALLAASGVSSPAQIRTLLRQTGNYGWIDTSGDGFHEPLLDVGDSSVFAPAMVAGTDPEPGLEPSVVILSPDSGTTFDADRWIAFHAEASDGQGADLSQALRWYSSRDGLIGTGASFLNRLSVGEHTITAQLDEPAASAVVVITVRAVSSCSSCHGPGR